MRDVSTTTDKRQTLLWTRRVQGQKPIVNMYLFLFVSLDVFQGLSPLLSSLEVERVHAEAFGNRIQKKRKGFLAVGGPNIHTRLLSRRIKMTTAYIPNVTIRIYIYI